MKKKLHPPPELSVDGLYPECVVDDFWSGHDQTSPTGSGGPVITFHNTTSLIVHANFCKLVKCIVYAKNSHCLYTQWNYAMIAIFPYLHNRTIFSKS